MKSKMKASCSFRFAKEGIDPQGFQVDGDRLLGAGWAPSSLTSSLLNTKTGFVRYSTTENQACNDAETIAVSLN